MEFAKALTVLFCAASYWLGGQELPVLHRGYKWIRRYLMPAGLCAGLILMGATGWKAVASCALLSIATHVGYGTSIPMLSITGLLMGLPAAILSFPLLNWMVGLPFIFHTAFGIVSVQFNRFVWAYVGLLMGLGIGIAYVTSL